jgi:copper oxidase (laccase) domain-containing protein
VNATGGRRAAERDLKARVEQHDALELRALPASERDRYSQDWRRIQAEFVDSPSHSLVEAGSSLMSWPPSATRPTGSKQADLISVDHPDLVRHCRQAHGVREGAEGVGLDTETARQAFVSYRALFAELLERQGSNRQEVNR